MKLPAVLIALCSLSALATPVTDGERLYTKQVCSACHSADGSPRAAPSFKGLHGKKQKLRSGKVVTVDDAFLRTSILEPSKDVTEGYQPLMPAYQGRLKPEEVDALVAYIKSLK